MVKITKLAANGKDQSPTISDGYWVVGELINAPKIGEPVVISRYNRNGVISFGVFNTSVVEKINGDGTFETRNSTYRIEEVADDEILATNES